MGQLRKCEDGKYGMRIRTLKQDLLSLISQEVSRRVQKEKWASEKAWNPNREEENE